MTEPNLDITLAQATILLIRYGFEMKGYFPQELIDKWLKDYSAKWIRTAIIEALYQGRYKAVSVEQILKLWGRREQMTCHFSHEFERLICRNLLGEGESGEYSLAMSQSPTNSERKTQRKSFNPPLIPEPNALETNTQQPLHYSLTAPKEEIDFEQKSEMSLNPDLSDENLSVNAVNEPHLIKNPEVNQLSLPINTKVRNEFGTPVNNSHDLKSELTNLDDLFTQFFADSDPKKSQSSTLYTSLDHHEQWRGIITGRTIDEFTPQLDSSELYSKLKAVVQQELEEKTQVNR